MPAPTINRSFTSHNMLNRCSNKIITLSDVNLQHFQSNPATSNRFSMILNTGNSFIPSTVSGEDGSCSSSIEPTAFTRLNRPKTHSSTVSSPFQVTKPKRVNRKRKRLAGRAKEDLNYIPDSAFIMEIDKSTIHRHQARLENPNNNLANDITRPFTSPETLPFSTQMNFSCFYPIPLQTTLPASLDSLIEDDYDYGDYRSGSSSGGSGTIDGISEMDQDDILDGITTLLDTCSLSVNWKNHIHKACLEKSVCRAENAKKRSGMLVLISKPQTRSIYSNPPERLQQIHQMEDTQQCTGSSSSPFNESSSGEFWEC